MKVGVPAGGETVTRAAHSLAAHPSVESVVIVGPGQSRDYEVVRDPSDCDVLVVSGPDAPERYAHHGIPMVWDGPAPAPGVAVWGASPLGLALAVAEREESPDLVAVAHPHLEEADEHQVRFPRPVGRVSVASMRLGDREVLGGRKAGRFAAVLVSGPVRSVAVVDDAMFMTGITLAGGVAALRGEPGPVWEDALAYLRTVTEMGLVMAAGGPFDA